MNAAVGGGGGGGEGGVAGAGVRRVGLHVALQLALLGAGVRAQRALERLLARVRAPVHDQVALEAEHLPAELARLELVRGRRRQRQRRRRPQQRRRGAPAVPGQQPPLLLLFPLAPVLPQRARALAAAAHAVPAPARLAGVGLQRGEDGGGEGGAGEGRDEPRGQGGVGQLLQALGVDLRLQGGHGPRAVEGGVGEVGLHVGRDGHAHGRAHQVGRAQAVVLQEVHGQLQVGGPGEGAVRQPAPVHRHAERGEGVQRAGEGRAGPAAPDGGGRGSVLGAGARRGGAQHLRGVRVRGRGPVGVSAAGVGGLRLGAGLGVGGGGRRRGAGAHVVDLHAVLLLGVLQQGPGRAQRQAARLAHELGRLCNTHKHTEPM